MKIQPNSVSILCCLGLAALCSVGSTQTTIIQDVIVDNDNGQDTRQTGGWYLSSGENPFGGTSVYSNSGGEFTWYALPENASYDLYAWWTYHPNRSRMVPYRVRIESVSGVDYSEFIVDQGDPNLGGRWNLLGTISAWSRAGGADVRITVSSENGQASADAVKLVYHSTPKVWPAAPCICDEYYMRGLAIYTSLGGRIRPNSATDTDLTTTCNIDGTEKDATFTTVLSGAQAGQSVQFRVDADLVDAYGFFECDARVYSAESSVYSRVGNGNSRDISIEACWASVEDLCTEN